MKMTLEQRRELADIYNETDIGAFEYMKPFCDGEWSEKLNRVIILNTETDIGCGREISTIWEIEEYYKTKWELLNHFGLENNMGDAFVPQE